jgi:hypothetical protein
MPYLLAAKRLQAWLQASHASERVKGGGDFMPVLRSMSLLLALSPTLFATPAQDQDKTFA